MADATPKALAPAVSVPAASAVIMDEEELKEQEMIISKYGERMMTLTRVSSRISGMLVCIIFISIVAGVILSSPNEINTNYFKVFCILGVGLVVAVSLLPLHCAKRVQQEQRIKGFYGSSCLLSTAHLLVLLLFGILLSWCYRVHFTWHGCGPNQCAKSNSAVLSNMLKKHKGPFTEVRLLDCFAKGALPDYTGLSHNFKYPSRCRKDSGDVLPFVFIQEDCREKLRAGPPLEYEGDLEDCAETPVKVWIIQIFDIIENNTWPFGLLLFLMSFPCALLATSYFAVQAGQKVHQARAKEVAIEMALLGPSVSKP